MNIDDFKEKLREAIKDKPLPDGQKFVISQYADDIVQNKNSNSPMSNIIIFLNARGCYIDIEDILCQHYIIKSVEDAHKTIERLLDLYKCKISPMNKAIGCIYTPPTSEQSSLSIKTFLAVMDYFKCEVKITNI